MPRLLHPLRGLFLLFMLGCFLPALAQWNFSTADPGATLWCGQPAKAITVDGKLEDWAGTPFAVILDKAHLGNTVYADPAIAGGDADCSGRIGMCWSGTTLYIAAQVRDDKLAPIDAKKGYAAPWFHDGLMIYLKATDALSHTGRYGKEYRRDPKLESWATLGLTHYQPGMQPRPLPGTSRYVARAFPGGYILEAAIDLPVMGYSRPLPGDRFKLAMLIIDHDPGQAALDAFGQLVWELGPRDSTREPATWGTLCLLREGVGSSAVASAQDEDGVKRLYMKALLDARRTDAVFHGAQVIDANDTVALDLPASQPLKPERRQVALASANITAFAPGTYTVRLRMKVGGKTQTDDVTRFTIESRAAPVSLPPTLSVPDGARVQKLDRPPAMKNVTKDDYLNFAIEMSRPPIST